jgi:hypothetical protein
MAMKFVSSSAVEILGPVPINESSNKIINKAKF